MNDLPSIFTGIVHGKLIELAQESGLPDGQAVSVIVRPVDSGLPPGEGLRRAFGAWDDDAEGLDQFLAETRQSRKRIRPEIKA